MKQLLTKMAMVMLLVLTGLQIQKVHAQCNPVTAGTYTIGPSGIWPSIRAAMDSIGARGVDGDVILELDPSYSSSVEVYPITVPDYRPVGCSANNPKLTLRPSAFVAGPILFSANLASPMFLINGADYFTLDGRPGGVGTARDTLIFVNTNASGNVFRFVNDAMRDTIRNIQIRSVNNTTSTTTAGAVQFMGTSFSFGNDSNAVMNCLIKGTGLNTLAIGIYTNGQAANIQNSHNAIVNNEFTLFSHSGILVDGGWFVANASNGSFWNISSNHFYDTTIANPNAGWQSAIFFYPGTASGSTFNTISNNFIGGTAPFAAGAPLLNTNVTNTFRGIFVFTQAGGDNSITGNTVRNLRFTGTSLSTFRPIDLGSGNATISGNTIGDNNMFSSISCFGNGTWAGITASGSVINISNNIISGLTDSTASTSVAVRGIWVSSATNLTVTNNTLRRYITLSTSSGTSTNGSLIGINITSSANSQIISGNQIGNDTLEGFFRYGNTVNGVVYGIAVSAGLNTINNNTINGLVNYSTFTSAGSGSHLTGIMMVGGQTGSTISNNIIRNIYSWGVAATQLNGILSQVSSNIIGNQISRLFTVSSNSNTTSSNAFNGILVGTSSTCNVSNNLVDSMTLNNNTSSAMTYGINSTSVSNAFTFNNNVIRNLTSNAVSQLISGHQYPMLAGIYIWGTSAAAVGVNINGNTIHSLEATNTAATQQFVIGIVYWGPTVAVSSNSVSRNFIHSLRTFTTNANSAIIGITTFQQGSATYANNMIRLGVDRAGNTISTPSQIRGIHNPASGSVSSPSINRFYHNTIYIAGTITSGSNYSACFDNQSSGNLGQGYLCDIRNNIFINMATNGGGTAQHLGLYTFTTTGGYLSDNNIFNISGSANSFHASNPGTFSSLKGASGYVINSQGRETNSSTAAVTLVNPAGNANTVDLHLSGISSSAEGTGDIATISFVTDDFDGQSRSSNSPVDIGADAVSITKVTPNQHGPIINYTVLTNTASTSTRTITATIFAHNGLFDSSSTFRPRLYYRKNFGTWTSSTGIQLAGNNREGTWQFTFDYADPAISGVLAGDVIRYYIAAQDSSNNLSSNIGIPVGTNITNITTHPITTNAFNIIAPLPTTINVGPGQTYTTLTGSGGLFAAINNGVLQGNTVVNITGDINEPATFALNQWLEINAGVMGSYNYTLTIRPSAAAPRLLRNTSSSGGAIRLDGADRVTITGIPAGGNPTDTFLTIRSIVSSFSPVITLLNDAVNNTLQNLIIEGRNSWSFNSQPTTLAAAVNISGTSLTTGNDNNAIRGCIIRDSSFITPSLQTAIWVEGTSARLIDNLTIENNQIYNFTATGINIPASGNTIGNNIVIRNNSIFYNASTPLANSITAIAFQPGTTSNNDTISGNFIGGNAPQASGMLLNNTTGSFTGITVTAGTGTGVSISSNIIRNIRMVNVSSTGTIIAVNVSSSVANISNNLIGGTLATDSLVHSGNGGITAIQVNNSGFNTIISGNLIQNFYNNTVAAGNNVTLRGIAYVGGTNDIVINNNTIRNFLITAPNITNTASGGNGSSIFGIFAQSSSASAQITNNTVTGFANMANSASNGYQMYGILATSNGIYQINNNVIRGFTSRSVPTFLGTITSSALFGIGFTGSSGGSVIGNNTLDSLFHLGNTAFTQLNGLVIGASPNALLVTNNTIRHLRTFAANASTSTSAALNGILVSSSGTNMVFRGNTIQMLSALNPTSVGVQVNGMLITGGSGLTQNINIVERNMINTFNLAATNTSTLVSLNGILFNSGFYTCQNNVISLGLDSTGASLTGPYQVFGINQNHSTISRYYHNSVYIGGTPNTGSVQTRAFSCTFTFSGSNTLDIRNNIFLNAASNIGTATGQHVALRLGGISNTTSNYNVLKATGIGGATANDGTNFVSLNGPGSWRAVRGMDLQSAGGDTSQLFVYPNAPWDQVDLHVKALNIIEGSGDPSLLVSNDFDGQTRTFPADVGADAGNFTLVADSFPSAITFTTLSNTGDLIGPITMANVNIRDNVGGYINLFGSFVPRLYYRKGAGTWVSTAASAVSGTPSNANYTFALDYTLVGGVVPTDVISYYIVAQDSLSGNLISNAPLAFGFDVNIITTHPTSPNTFTILPSIPAGSRFTIGTGSGQQFNSLSNTGGFFEFLNANSIGGDVYGIISSNTVETGSIQLNPIGQSVPGNWRVYIMPDSSQTERIVSGNFFGSLITFNGADNVVITGIPDTSTNSTLRRLRIRNSSTSGVAVTFINDATQNKLQNLIIETANTFNGNGGVVFSTSNVTNGIGNDQDTIINCLFRNDQTLVLPNGVPSNCIYSLGTVGRENSNNVIIQNEFTNFNRAGLELATTGNGGGWVFSNNHVYNNLALPPSGFVFGTLMNAGPLSNGNIISNNFIGGSTLFCGGAPFQHNGNNSFNGIRIDVGTQSPTIITGNVIRNINMQNSGNNSQFGGIVQFAGNVNIGTIAQANIIGDSLVSNSITINGTFGNHQGISVNGIGTVNIIGNRIHGITINAPAQAVALNGIIANTGTCVISNNVIGRASLSNSININSNSFISGISSSVPVGVSPNITITNNTIAGFSATGNYASNGVRGIVHTGTSVPVITGNVLQNLNTASVNTTTTGNNAITGINIQAAINNAGSRISNNTISNLNNTSTDIIGTNVSAILLTGGITNPEISRNRIFQVTNATTNTSTILPSTVTGINILSLTSGASIFNNQISLGNGSTTNTQFTGIWQQSSGGFNVGCYYNTVVISGTVGTGNQNSYAYMRGNNSGSELNSAMTLVNNAFVNLRSGGTGSHFAIANQSNFALGSGWFGSTINYNFLYASNGNQIGQWGPVNLNFADWRSNSLSDNNSWSASLVDFNANSLFNNISAGNLNVNTVNNASWYLNGKGIAGILSNSINTDFNNTTRGTTLGFGTDIGSHEFTTSTMPPAANAFAVVALNTSVVYTFGGRTIATINWGNTGTVPSSVTLQYYTGVNAPNAAAGRNLMNAYLAASATGGSGFSYNLQLNYDPAIMGNVSSESNLRMAFFRNSTWTFDSISTVNTVARIINTSNLSQITTTNFTGTDVTNPLPVVLGYFNAKASGVDAELNWATFAEVNNNGFYIERSVNGEQFEEIGFVKGRINSSRAMQYNFTDKNAASVAQTIFYRLRQVDVDGSYDYSQVAILNFIKQTENRNAILAYPNPFSTQLTLAIQSGISGDATLHVYDLTGKKVVNSFVKLTNGLVSTEAASNLNAGIYFAEIICGNELFKVKLIKE